MEQITVMHMLTIIKEIEIQKIHIRQNACDKPHYKSDTVQTQVIFLPHTSKKTPGNDVTRWNMCYKHT
ncbi:MAG: hypothetical protein GWO41_17535 [candidate division Zixibacteria bacterium]|nr:hypothetical protein [candidate division Zixibacteria bacterium]NIR66512.1 hypothetical protein [candidate division Zixibacteria bacterium]NIS48082.1 hypothetical protein [candidate division Zixibacteria bacterium]NIT54494.1 hypothetical protein [candidate division Zixibacteria bacterium]NIU16200.1 hypothetical protein [candidate division Zixibacteria bacterium]